MRYIVDIICFDSACSADWYPTSSQSRNIGRKDAWYNTGRSGGHASMQTALPQCTVSSSSSSTQASSLSLPLLIESLRPQLEPWLLR